MRMSMMIRGCLMTIVFFTFSCGNHSDKGANSPSEGRQEADSLLLSTYPDSVSLRMAVSDRHETGGHLSLALQVIEAGLQRDSLQVILWNRKASLLLAMGDTTGTISSLLRSLSVNPGQTDILLELGFIYADRRDTAAISVADRILSPAGDPRFRAEAHYLKGIFYGNIGQFRDAIRSYDDAISTSYTFTDAYIEKGILFFEQQRINEALGVFEKALTVNNALADAYYWRGRCLESAGKKEAALEDYRRALSLDPEIRGAIEGEKRLEK